MSRAVGNCDNCGHTKTIVAHGLCAACNQQQWRAQQAAQRGFPERFLRTETFKKISELMGNMETVDRLECYSIEERARIQKINLSYLKTYLDALFPNFAPPDWEPGEDDEDGGFAPPAQEDGVPEVNGCPEVNGVNSGQVPEPEEVKGVNS